MNTHSLHDQFGVKGHVGVTGVKKVIFTKNAIFLQITWYGTVTHAYSSAKYPLQPKVNLGSLGVTGVKKIHFCLKCYNSPI